jgi:hypothetical protein
MDVVRRVVYELLVQNLYSQHEIESEKPNFRNLLVSVDCTAVFISEKPGAATSTKCTRSQYKLSDDVIKRKTLSRWNQAVPQ